MASFREHLKITHLTQVFPLSILPFGHIHNLQFTDVVCPAYPYEKKKLT